MRPERDRIRDELYVLRCRRGDAQAWRDLIAAWQPRLFYYIRRLVPQESDAWDVLQQTWLGAYRGIGTLADPKNVAAWLYRIARNTAISHRRIRVDEPGEIDDANLGTDDPAEVELENAEAIHAALDRISVAHRDVLTLHFLQDLSIEQIAEVIDVPEGTVKSRIHHAKRALKQVLQNQEAAP